MTITYRAQKGTLLTPAEVDENFNDLDGRTGAGWRDLVMGFDSRTGPNAATLTNFRGGIYLYAFDASMPQEVFATAHIDHDYEYGSALYPHIHFTVDTANTGTVRWGFEYTVAQRHDGAVSHFTFGPTTTVYAEHVINGTAYTHYVAEVGDADAIPGANIDIDTVILFRIFRDANHVNDTFVDPVFGFTADLHYRANRNATPNKVAPFL